MKRKGTLLLAALVCLIVVIAFGSEESAKNKNSEITTRSMPEQVVLYKIVRGHYSKAGMAIGQLYSFAGMKGLQPKGGPIYVYLNNPKLVSSEHWLTEIRIPVSEKALEQAGTLGEMTDIKKVPAMEFVVAVKPEGMADPSAIYEAMTKYIYENGYTTIDAPAEITLSGASTGDYTKVKSEILMPIKKQGKPCDKEK